MIMKCLRDWRDSKLGDFNLGYASGRAQLQMN